MIRLVVEKYCDNCPEFEAHVEKNIDVLRSFSPDSIRGYYEKSLTNTTITCEHSARCACMMTELTKVKEKKDGICN